MDHKKAKIGIGRLKISRSVALLMFLYFIQGLPYGFQARFLPILLRSRGTSLTDLGVYKLLLAPWLCKALWAPLVDHYGTKRRWLLASISGLAGACVLGSLLDQTQIMPFAVVLFLLNFFAATQDIAVDALAVAILSREELGHGNTAQVVGYKIGSIFGGGVLVWFLDWIGWTGMFLALTALYVEAFMFVFVSPSIRSFEEEASDTDDLTSKAQFEDCDDVFLRDNKFNDGKNKISSKTHTDRKHINKKQNIQDYQQTFAQKLACKLSFVKVVAAVPGTKWMMAYVLLYKLGEQGSLSMLPMLMVDHHVATNDVTFWTAVVGQAVSVVGSLIGGALITNYRFPIHLILKQTLLLRLLPLGGQLLLVVYWEKRTDSSVCIFGLAVLLMNISLLLSGIVTTATFTYMMMCSKSAPSGVQATHYTTLASLEVFGKLTFMSVAGWMVDCFGYSFMYLVFVGLGYLVVMLYNHCPASLSRCDNEESNFVDNNRQYEEGQFDNCEEKKQKAE